MKTFTTLMTVALFLLTLPMAGVAADDRAAQEATKVASLDVAKADPDLVEKRTQFQTFASAKIKQLNRNHRWAKSRMQIIKQPDGSYVGKYHQIDDQSLAVKVRRSSSKAVPYVGILSYREQILEGRAPSADALAQAKFAVKQIIPNKHLFSYMKGKWQ